MVDCRFIQLEPLYLAISGSAKTEIGVQNNAWNGSEILFPEN